MTHTVLATTEARQHIASLGTPLARKVLDLLQFFEETYRRVFKFPSPPVHDPVAVAYVIAPELFSVERMRVDIEVGSRLCAGQTVCDTWHMSQQEQNVDVAMRVDVDAIWDLLIDAVRACSERAVGAAGQHPS